MITLNRKSWHYWLASEFGNSFGYAEPVSMCKYVKDVIVGLGKFLGVVIVCGGVLAAVIDTIWYLYQIAHALITHTKLPGEDDIAIVVITIVVVSSLLVGYAEWKDYRDCQKLMREHETPSENPSFIVMAWRTIRDKTCVKVDFQ
jgi:uncharacterized membrane protein YidH (DUF202 family)